MPALSKKSESKITKPFAAVAELIGPKVPTYAPLDPTVLFGVVNGPRYSHFASGSLIPLAVPELVQLDGIPFEKSSLQIIASGIKLDWLFWFEL